MESLACGRLTLNDLFWLGAEDGWGIHMSSRGAWVWNLWGRDCVLIHLTKGVLRIGTDDAEALLAFLDRNVDETENCTPAQNEQPVVLA